jgi:hypothetical protein
MKPFYLSSDSLVSSISVLLAVFSCDCSSPDFKTDRNKLPDPAHRPLDRLKSINAPKPIEDPKLGDQSGNEHEEGTQGIEDKQGDDLGGNSGPEVDPNENKKGNDKKDDLESNPKASQSEQPGASSKKKAAPNNANPNTQNGNSKAQNEPPASANQPSADSSAQSPNTVPSQKRPSVSKSSVKAKASNAPRKKTVVMGELLSILAKVKDLAKMPGEKGKFGKEFIDIINGELAKTKSVQQKHGKGFIFGSLDDFENTNASVVVSSQHAQGLLKSTIADAEKLWRSKLKGKGNVNACNTDSIEQVIKEITKRFKEMETALDG